MTERIGSPVATSFGLSNSRVIHSNDVEAVFSGCRLNSAGTVPVNP